MKEQGSAVMRIVAFAVALAVVLGFASVLFSVTASAESDDSFSFGSLGSIDGFSIVSESSLNSNTLLSLMQLKKEGAIFLVARHAYGSFTLCYHQLIFKENGDKFDIKKYCSSPFSSNIYKSIFDRYDPWTFLNASASSSTFTYWQLPNSPVECSIMSVSQEYISDCSTCSFYWCYAPTSFDDGQVTSEIYDTYSDHSGFNDGSSSSSPSAEFVSCKSSPTGYPEGVLWFEDWIKEGMQYPYFSWYIRDNGNHHSYSVKFSYNSSQVDTCEKVFNNRFYDELENVKQNPLLLFAESGVIYAASKLKWLAEQTGFLTNITAIQWKNLSYTDSFALSSDDMDFSSCENSGNKVFSVCLSDYSDIGRYFIYRADIIDNTTGQVLDTTFFCPLNKFSNGNSGYGSKIYDYGDDGDGMLDDLINNTPSVDPSIKNPFDISGDVIDNNYGGGSISDINISDISSSLESSVNSVSVFFRFCWSLFPSQIWSVILLGLSLIIILRVLGR